MANVFLSGGHEEIETAILLENATQCDLGELNRAYKNAVAFTDGNKVFVNSDDNLAKILPDYNQGMLKWLLWHEEYHKQLKHHRRFFKYLDELRDCETIDEFHVTKDEVNIIMDILVHDSLAKLFPELVPTAVNNLAQMRNRNSLGYTFKTNTLEEMLKEYSEYKHKDKDEDKKKGDGEGEGTPEEKDGEGEGIGDKKTKDKSDEPEDGEGEKGHEDGGGRGHSKGEDDAEPELKDTSEPKSEPELEPEHDKTDWSKLNDINTKEFIGEYESESMQEAIKELKNKKLKLARLTEKLNGLATTTRVRTYARPSYIGVDKSIMLKGRKPGKTSLYLVFDASGSMGEELALFKKIISESIPHAMTVPCEWFSGDGETVSRNPEGRSYDYYKGTFKDIMPVYATGGYSDDGDRTIELCLKAEEKGFTPIGVTDGGGGIYEPKVLKKLTRTVLVGDNENWLRKAKEINPRIETICIQKGGVFIMYSISKDKGNNQNIMLTNAETKASVIIGKLTMAIMGILEKEVEFDESKEHTIKLKDKWDFTISDEAGKELAKMASPIKKPIRNQSKTASEQTQSVQRKKTKSGREVVDVFDLIFGTN